MYAVGLALEDVSELMDEDRAEAAARVDRAIDAIHLSIQDIRNFIFGLRPGLLEGATLAIGLASLAEEYRHNMIVDLELRLPDPVADPPAEVTGHLLAVVAESLSNVARHSHAGRASVELSTPAQGGLELTIEDNGVGFDPAAIGKIGHHGLANTRDRVAKLGGSVTIDSHTGGGTRVVVRIPHLAN
jgi:signal transduction histidine kinase